MLRLDFIKPCVKLHKARFVFLTNFLRRVSQNSAFQLSLDFVILYVGHDLTALWQHGCKGFDKLLRGRVLRALAFDKLFERLRDNALVVLR